MADWEGLMPDALLTQLALVSESTKVTPSDLAQVGAALQKQITRDVMQFWEVKATIDVFPKLEDVPIGYWKVIVMDDIGQKDGIGGIHTNKLGEPFALVKSHADIKVWSLSASHEAIEMIVDPSLSRRVEGDSPKPEQGRVQYLVEVCDPCQACAYWVNGILVSDFYTPRYFDPVAAPEARYSYTRRVTQPRQILKGGYLTWLDPVSNDWWRASWSSGESPQFVHIGELLPENGSLRSQETSHAVLAIVGDLPAGAPSAAVEAGRKERADMLRRQIAELCGS
jgi:hypothetical protein